MSEKSALITFQVCHKCGHMQIVEIISAAGGKQYDWHCCGRGCNADFKKGDKFFRYWNIPLCDFERMIGVAKLQLEWIPDDPVEKEQ